MRYCFDLDGTLCETVGDNYGDAEPLLERISFVNKLYDEGNHIIIETARGSRSGKEWKPLTEMQLRTWGVRYHELRTGVKIAADHYVDDKGLNASLFFGMHDIS